MEFLDELRARGLIHQIAEHEEVPLRKLLETPQTVYAGFDPTATSLHIGNLIPLLGLRRFQQAGHKVIALAGGATGMVGDPSGRSSERNLLTEDVLAENVRGIKGQLERLLDFTDGRAVLVDNLDWTRDVSYLDFLRDIGKHFTINTMLRKDSVKGRLDREGEGISYTEFSYQLLQAFDFLHLFGAHDCKIQIGGSDQWGNITAGTDLIRRKLGQKAYGVTFPLLLNADGAKFGKSQGASVWLDPERTSPFAFRQFWFGVPDADVIKLLRYFTFVPLDEIEVFERDVEAKQNPQAAQRRLAEVMTELVHGADEAAKVETAAKALFSKDQDFTHIASDYMADAFAGAPVTELSKERLAGDGLTWLEVVVLAVPDVDKAGNAKQMSNGAARRLIQQNSLALNGKKQSDMQARVTTSDLLHGQWLVIKKGKRHYFLVRSP